MKIFGPKWPKSWSVHENVIFWPFKPFLGPKNENFKITFFCIINRYNEERKKLPLNFSCHKWFASYAGKTEI